MVAFARQLLSGNYVRYTGDPLEDFTQTAFLDRFVYRNPKKKVHGGRNTVLASKRVSRTQVRMAPPPLSLCGVGGAVVG